MKAKLTLETAKELYKEGGAGKAFALDNFTEEELKERWLPKTWEEYHSMFFGGYIIAMNRISSAPSKYQALRRLELLRDYYNGSWEPDWSDGSWKLCIEVNDNDSKIEFTMSQYQHRPLAFKDGKTGAEFLKNFSDLILEAEDLI